MQNLFSLELCFSS